MTADMPDAAPFTFTYRNWRGEISERRAIPIRVWFGSTEWHPDPQWFLNANDLDKGETRDFAMRDIGARAMQAAMAGREVRVKALEWVEQNCGHGTTWRAESSFGRYLVYMRPDNSWAFEPPFSFGGKLGLRSPNAAMTAAQADYDRRILSALEPAGAQEGAEDDMAATRRAAWKDTALIREASSRVSAAREHTTAPDALGLVRRLNQMAGKLLSSADIRDIREAADTIAALQAEVERLKERNAEHEERFAAESSLADHYKGNAERLRRIGAQLANIVSNTVNRYHAHEQGPAREVLSQWDGSVALAPADKAGG